jgi:hypothetical protein
MFIKSMQLRLASAKTIYAELRNFFMQVQSSFSLQLLATLILLRKVLLASDKDYATLFEINIPTKVSSP